MYLYQVLRANPFAALAICFCLVTAWLCMRTVRHRLGPDRCLVGVLGFLSIFQGLRILAGQNGTFASTLQRYQGIADASVAALFLLAALMLRSAIAEHVNTKMQLRLVEGEKAAGRLAMQLAVLHDLGAATRPNVVVPTTPSQG